MLTTPDFKRSVRPIFIIGAPRSGTSVTTWVLGQLPNVQPLPETTWIATLATGAYLSHAYGSARGRFTHLSNVNYDLSAFMRRIGEAADAIAHDCFEERCRRLYGDYKNSGELHMHAEQARSPHQIRRALDDPKRRWIDGTPYNSYFVWALNLMFPDAQFIHNLRRPDDVATSLEGFDKFGHDSLELKEGLQVWASHTDQAQLAERALGSQKVFRLQFERIAEDQEGLVRELCAFLGEDYNANCLLPLSERINSSEVDHRRTGNLARLDEMPEFQGCASLYKELMARPPNSECDPSALDTLRSRFVQYCMDHPLL
jgi:hypothetical protein